MNNKILNTVNKFNMLSYGDTVLVGCSGGADSMLLLNFLLSVKEQFNLTIKVAHIEHGIRGDESLADADFVKAFCSANNVEFFLFSIDAVKESQRLKIGLEEYSRNKRYELFNSVDCDKIATAHSLSDNAETVLFRLARGTGLKGVCGIPPVRGKIIRPLIELNSKEIRDYCRENSIAYRVDSTNLCNDYSRNYIRNEIIPLMQNVNGEFLNNVNKFVQNISQDCDFIEKYSISAYNYAFADNAIKLSVLRAEETAVKKRIIKKYFEDNGITLDYIHLNSVLALIDKPSRTQIKGDIFAVADNEYLKIKKISKNNNEKIFNFTCQITKKSEFINKNVDFFCDYDKISGGVLVRSRISGDKIKPYKRGCTKTLKKLFNELKIPDESRCGIGVVADDIGVIGVVGHCVDERVAVTGDTVNVLSLKLLTEDNNGESF